MGKGGMASEITNIWHFFGKPLSPISVVRLEKDLVNHPPHQGLALPQVLGRLRAGVTSTENFWPDIFWMRLKRFSATTERPVHYFKSLEIKVAPC